MRPDVTVVYASHAVHAELIATDVEFAVFRLDSETILTKLNLEGVTWLRGVHPIDSTDVKALLAAHALCPSGTGVRLERSE